MKAAQLGSSRPPGAHSLSPSVRLAGTDQAQQRALNLDLLLPLLLLVLFQVLLKQRSQRRRRDLERQSKRPAVIQVTYIWGTLLLLYFSHFSSAQCFTIFTIFTIAGSSSPANHFESRDRLFSEPPSLARSQLFILLPASYRSYDFPFQSVHDITLLRRVWF